MFISSISTNIATFSTFFEMTDFALWIMSTILFLSVSLTKRVTANCLLPLRPRGPDPLRLDFLESVVVSCDDDRTLSSLVEVDEEGGAVSDRLRSGSMLAMLTPPALLLPPDEFRLLKSFLVFLCTSGVSDIPRRLLTLLAGRAAAAATADPPSKLLSRFSTLDSVAACRRAGLQLADDSEVDKSARSSSAVETNTLKKHELTFLFLNPQQLTDPIMETWDQVK